MLKVKLTTTPYQKDFDKQIQIAKKVMKKYRNVLNKLSK